MSITAKKSFKSAFSEAYPYGAESIFAVFTEFKGLFKVHQSFKRKGVLYELYEYWTDGPTYAVILIDGKTVHHFESSYIRGRLIDIWQELIGFRLDQYINGCPHYTMDNASEVEVIKNEDRFLEFHKVATRTVKGSPIKSKYDKIKGTPFQIGRPVMYNITKEGKNNFFYTKGYAVLKYDVKYNLSIEKRFNTRFQVVSSIGGNSYTKTLNELISNLEAELKKYTGGYWSGSPCIWNEPNPKQANKIQAQIEAVKKFQSSYKGQE